MKIFCQLLTALYQAQTYTWIHGLFHMSNILVVLSLWPWLPWQSLNVKQVYTKVKRLHHSDSWDNIPQLPYMCIQTLLCSTLRNCSAFIYMPHENETNPKIFQSKHPLLLVRLRKRLIYIVFTGKKKDDMPIVFFPFFWFHLNFFDGLCIFVKNRQNDSNLGKKIVPLIGLDPSLFISIST